jgi:inorganic pyrophosphatase
MQKCFDFWQALDVLADEHELVIDRPRGSVHPRYSEYVYPLDYGYLRGTSSSDGGGIDVWRGSSAAGVVAVMVTVDMVKRDSEI